MASFPVNDFTEGAWKSKKMIKIIMGPGGADSVHGSITPKNPMIGLVAYVQVSRYNFTYSY